MVADRGRGELNPSYLEWFYNQDALADRPGIIVKSTAEWESEIRNSVGLAAEEMKKGYESKFGALQEELGIVKVDRDLMYDTFEKEKAQWA